MSCRAFFFWLICFSWKSDQIATLYLLKTTKRFFSVCFIVLCILNMKIILYTPWTIVCINELEKDSRRTSFTFWSMVLINMAKDTLVKYLSETNNFIRILLRTINKGYTIAYPIQAKTTIKQNKKSDKIVIFLQWSQFKENFWETN